MSSTRFGPVGVLTRERISHLTVRVPYVYVLDPRSP